MEDDETVATAPAPLRGAPRLPRYECKVCWAVYDPALGDELWQVAPGTAFADLPAHWTCPQCSAQRHEFLLLAD